MQRSENVPRFSQKNEKRLPGKRILSLFLASLVSASTLFGEIMPFGVALYAAEYSSAPPYFLGCIVILAALMPHFLPAIAIKYALSVFLFSILVSRHGKEFIKTPLRRGGVMGASVFVSGLFLLLGGQILIYDCFILFLEAGIVLLSTCLFASAKKTVLQSDRHAAPFDILSVSALFGVAVLGLSGFFSLYGLYVTVPFSVLAILLLTHESGLTSGAIAGITLGLFATLESGDPVLGTFAASGMAAGYFSRYGRGGAAAAFICASAVVSFYIGGSTEMVLRRYEIAAPALVFLALPGGLLGRLTTGEDNLRVQNSRAARLLAEDLKDKADAFTFLSETFTEISENKLQNGNMAAAAFFEKAARRACEGCPKLSLCWKKEFHRTYAAFFVMLEICMKKGALSSDDIPISLEEKCVRRAALLEAFNAQYEIYKVDKLWESRVQEVRTLLSRQLSSVAHILAVMEKNVKSGTAENRALEDLLSAQLGEMQIPVRSITVTEKRRGAPTVSLQTSPETSPEALLPTLSDMIGTPMQVTSAHGGRFSFSPTCRIHLRISGESIPKNDSPKSGDSFDSLYLENGCYLLLLSDGMGSGVKASMESRAAVKMLRALFSAGFDADTAIGLVNSVLVLKSAEESFATIDLLSLNTHTLEAEFMKVGAAASFIKRGKAVRAFSAGTLPVGVLPSPDTARLSAKVSPGDMIIMVSDGAFDPARKAEDATFLLEAIRAYDGDDPADLTQTLLRLAREKCGGHIGDDMTVLCATVCENEDFIA